MLKWKTFVQGQGLNEELLSFADRKTTKSQQVRHRQQLEGSKVRQAYEEIINEPSSAVSAVPTSPPVKIRTLSSTGRIIPKPEKAKAPSPKKQKPTLHQLMRLCESDEAEKLSSEIEISDWNLNDTDEFGWTLLMCAACAGSVNCVESLLKSGANWTLRDKTGHTAFDLAQKKQKKDVCTFLAKWAKEKQRNIRHSQTEADISPLRGDNSVEVESAKFCESCKSDYTSERIHVKSIAHLVGTSGNVEDKVHYVIPESNRGFQLMLKTGWDGQHGLGTSGQGQKFPVKTVLKRDRKGLGNSSDRKAARITHFGPFDTAAVENPKLERLEKHRTVKRKEDLKRKSKDKVKEIKFRRELSSI